MSPVYGVNIMIAAVLYVWKNEFSAFVLLCLIGNPVTMKKTMQKEVSL